MIALPSLRNVEFGFFFGEVLSVSGSRSQISLPRKFIFYRPNLKYRCWSNVSFESRVEPAAPPMTAAEEETKVVLHKFLRKQGFSRALATTTINKSDLFIEHLLSRLDSLPNGSPVGLVEFDWLQLYIACLFLYHQLLMEFLLNPTGDELTAAEIRDALIPYLESLLEDYGSNLVDFLENFPNPSTKGDPVVSVSSSNLTESKRLKALSRVTDGQPPPHILYLLELGMDIEQIKRVTGKYPYFAYIRLDDKIRPLIEFLLSFGISNSDIPTILIKLPQLSVLSLSGNIIPTMKFLEKLGLDKRRWARVLCRYPIILALSRQKLEAVVDFLLEMGLSAEGVGKVLTRFPHITGYSVVNNLQPTADYLQSLGVRVDVVILKWPQAFALSIEDNLKPTTEFFLSQGYSREEVASMVSRCGGLYTCSLSKNLIPKWEFFLTMNYSKAELPKFPQYFSYSLEGRIKPRYAAVKASGVKFTLNHMLSLPDDKFVKTLKAKTFRQSLR